MSAVLHAHEGEEWEEFVTSRSNKLRERLIAKYEPFANILAAKLYAGRQIDEIEFDEYKQYALVGLMESVDRYDATRNASFETYASHRIKGAILNGIEKYNEKQQQLAIRTKLRRERTESILQTAAEIEQDTFTRLMDIALGVAVGYMLEDTGMYQSGYEIQEAVAYKSMEISDLLRAIDNLVETLPDVEEKIIRLHYYQEKRFDYIAEMLSLSKGRIAQLHHRALKRLYEHYDELKLLRTEY